MHLANDMISSVMVPLGYQVVFYKTDGFQGESTVVVGDAWANDGTQQMKCQPMPSGFGDAVSSL